MKILLHICCGPCSIIPFQTMRSEGHEVTGFWFNHNIHPYTEYTKRLDAAREYASKVHLEMIVIDEYRLEDFLANTSEAPENRCTYCYMSRLEIAARTAAESGFDAFTSSLLYSRYQRHEEIRQLCEKFAKQYGINFHYADYRNGWQEGIRISKELGLYRQQYCGCVYSEKERYWKP